MKKVCTIFIIIFLNVLSVQKLFATHAAGGELIYTLVPNTTNQYEFTFKFYRDCSGVAEPSTFTMCYNNTCGVTNQSVTLSKIIGNLPNGQPNGSPIVQVGCYNQATICQGGVVAGYREWWYTGTVTLNSTCNFWRFWVSLCCRNNAIGNVITPGSQNIFIETDFDNTINLNSSPFVASPPIAYYCVNTPSFAYYTAIDPDGDSIAYESIAPQHNNAGCNNLAPVNIFSAPYTIAEPFPTGNTFNIDPVTGVISFTPTTQGAWVFSVKIKEYRNGQYIGYVMRDIQFVVSVCNLPPPLSVFATYAPITCYGDLTTVTGIGNGGITPYQYQLNGGGFQPGNQFNGIGAGIYTITVMDANNCTSSTVFTITEPPPFLLTINNIIDPACNMPCSGSAQSGIVGGVSPYQYSITAPGIIDINTGLISGLCAGAYTVTVTDANGCTATSTLNVVQPTLGVSVSMQNNITCYGSCNGTAQASNIGGVNPISYAISAPAVINAATGSISALCAGTYTITITDATTCTGTTILTVTEPPLLTITVSNIINETCNGACNGSSQSTASGGTLPYTYAISAPGNTNASGFNSALCGGTYTVTVTDANGCTASSTFAVAQAQLLTLAFSNILNVTCNGLCDGSSQVAAAGGNAPYNYTISPAGNINAVSGAATALCAGVFTVSVTDANGCSASGTFNITEPPVLTLTINNINNVLCAGDCNGTAQALASGGATPFVYSVNSPGIINANTGALSALCAGSYTVTVNDVNGCSSSAVFQVTEPAALAWANTTAVNVNCHGGSDGSISTTATGGTGTINYTLQPNNITNISGQFTNLIAGVYTVSAVDANGCSISTVLTITEPVLLQLTNLANTQPTCVPGNDGSLTVTASGGTPAYTYNIGGANQASNVFLNLGAGNYTVTVTDANGCTASSTITIAAPNSPVISAVLTTDVTCNGGNDGAITATASGGLGALNYNLQPGNVNNASGVFSNLTAGIYTITVGDANGCTVSSTAIIAQPLVLSWSAANAVDVNCNGGNDGSITVNAAGGTGIISYNLQPGNVTNANGIFNNLIAGIYTLTATDANGCSLTITLQVSQAPPITWLTATAVNVTCNGGSDGSIAVTATGGTGILNYTLQPNNITNVSGQFTNLIAGVYTVSAVDANGCSTSTVLTITEPVLLQLTNLANTQPTCVPGNDGSLTVTAGGGTPAYTYNIGGANQASNVFLNLGAGNYTVTVTDANGCTASSTITIAAPNSPVISAVLTTDVTCNGGNDGAITTTASGGLGALNYNLQPGNVNNASGVFSNLTAGIYTITVGDANGCTVSSTASVNEPVALTWTSALATDVLCFGGSDGSATVAATGGTGAINYNLQPGNQNNAGGIFANLIAGTYTLTATDANGCSITTILQVNQPTALAWTVTALTDISCNGGNDGSIAATATGGTGIINYTLQPNNITNVSGQFTNLIAGVYTVSAVDANGCSTSTVLTITEPVLLQLTNLANTQPTCVPGNDGSLTVSASGGTPAYTYNIGGANQASNVFSNLGAGNYTVTVTDANGCTASSTITIAAPNSPIINSVLTTDVTCNGGNDGAITAAASGGLGALNYNLQPGNVNNASGVFSNLTAGIYTITVGDANGCTVSSTATVNEPVALAWTSAVATDVLCFGGSDGSATVAATGGTGAINYNLQPGNQNNAGGIFANLIAGTYTLTATDANGCSITTILQVNQPTALAWTVTALTDISCNGGNDGSIAVTATGGTGIINYTLQPNNINNVSGQFTNLIAGVYTVSAVDVNGCSTSTVVTITEPVLLQLTNLATTQPTCVPGNDGSLTVTASGGTPAYTYNIGGANQASNVFLNLGAGNYTVTVTDANGCTASSTITIAAPNSPVISNMSATDVSCNGGNNGTITVIATGGLGALVYTLQPGNVNNANGQFTGLPAGTFTVIAGDANGCTVSSTIAIAQPPAISWTGINVSNVNCNGGNDGGITATATGGTGALSYTLLPNNITNATGIFPNLTAGAYTVTAVDANNCSLTIFLQVNQATVITWSNLITTDVQCNAGSDGSITIAATGGMAPMLYTLLPNNINNAVGIFTNLLAGIYTMQATDANGCTLSTVITITEPLALQLIAVTVTQPSCVPGNDGTISITAVGGTPVYTYSIGGAGQAANIFNNIGAAAYTVVVTDANGCSSTSAVNIAPPNSPVITNVTTTPANCNPGNNGQVTITANGGNGIYSYSADGINFQANNTITGLAAGNYTITVLDAMGCSVSSLIVIGTTPSPVITSVVLTNATCIPGCDGTALINATGGNAVYSFSIDNVNFQAGNSFANVCANIYTATVVDGNGCTATSQFTITSANAPVLTINNTTDILCNGGNNGAISATATGAGAITYLLLPNGVSNLTGLFSNLTANTYTVQATDVNGCSSAITVLVSEPPLLQIANIINAGALCAAANNGNIDIVTSGGTGMITFNINPFGNFVPPTMYNNLIGNTTYTVTATDANGCSVTSSVFIAEPQPIIFTSTISANVSCNNGNDGIISVQAIGGTGVLNYSLQPNAQNNISGLFNNLTANQYTITVTDANNCTLTTLINITEPPAIVVNALTAVDITCYNVNDGSININGSGGTGVLTYSVQPGNLSNISGVFNNLSGNIYSITITDANGCTLSTSIAVVNPTPLTINAVTLQHVLCFGDSNASITVNVSGGTGLLTYNLLPQNINNNNGQFANLPAGSYTITTTDANLCSLSTTVLITEPALLTAAVLNIQNILCSGAFTGQIDIGATGGTMPYNFTLTPGNVNNASGQFANLPAGTYTVNVTDSNNCYTIVQPIIITEPPAIKIEGVVATGVKCFGDSTGSLEITANGGTGNIILSLLPVAGVQAPAGTFTGLPAGIYTITATDANNCTVSSTATIVQNPAILISNISLFSPKCWGDLTGIIHINAAGGVGQLSYSLNNQAPDSTGFFNQLPAGNYLATITDTMGCSIDTLITLTQPDKVSLSSLDIFPVFCRGYSDGKVQAQATGGNGGYTYYLRPGLNVNNFGFFENLHEGSYSLTVKDALGCTFDTVIAVTPPMDPLRILITKKDLGCYGKGTEGWALANIMGGNAPYTYLWNSSPPQFDPKAIDLKYGKYLVEVIDAKGCKEKDSVVIEAGQCCEEVFVPNAFSPNGDGNNDVFRVTTSTGIELVQFEIYDRWGRKVWYTDDFREGWDGNERGQPRDMNTYYYIFRYKCLYDGENYMKKGDINLVR